MNDAQEEAYRARIRAARKAEVEAAKATIAAHKPPAHWPREEGCHWCTNPRAYTVMVETDIPELDIKSPSNKPRLTTSHTFPACEAHMLRALEGGARIEGDVDGKRAAELIARAAVLRVKRGPA